MNESNNHFHVFLSANICVNLHKKLSWQFVNFIIYELSLTLNINDWFCLWRNMGKYHFYDDIPV